MRKYARRADRNLLISHVFTPPQARYSTTQTGITRLLSRGGTARD
jgi:hypothetical protein